MGKGSRRSLYRRLVEEFAIWERLNPAEKGLVLDYGCGDGWLAGKLAMEGFRIVGVDVKKEPLLVARGKVPKDRALVVLYPGDFIPMRSGAVDLVLAVGVVRSLLDRGPMELALSEWRRCLRPKGRVILIETDNAPLRRYMEIMELPKAMEEFGFKRLAWYPIRRTSWWGLTLVKWGLFPHHLIPRLAKWEVMRRKLEPLGSHVKKAYLGEFEKE